MLVLTVTTAGIVLFLLSSWREIVARRNSLSNQSLLCDVDVSYTFVRPFAVRTTSMYALAIGGRYATEAKLLDLWESWV